MTNIKMQLGNLDIVSSLFDSIASQLGFNRTLVNAELLDNIYTNARILYQKVRYEKKSDSSKWLELYIDMLSFKDFANRIYIKTSNNELDEIMCQSYFEVDGNDCLFYPAVDDAAFSGEKQDSVQSINLESETVEKIFLSVDL